MTQIEKISKKVNETADKLAALEQEQSSYQALMTEAVSGDQRR